MSKYELQIVRTCVAVDSLPLEAPGVVGVPQRRVEVVSRAFSLRARRRVGLEEYQRCSTALAAGAESARLLVERRPALVASADVLFSL